MGYFMYAKDTPGKYALTYRDLLFFRREEKRTHVPLRALIATTDVRMAENRPKGFTVDVVQSWFRKKERTKFTHADYITWLREIYASLPSAVEKSSIKKEVGKAHQDMIPGYAFVTCEEIDFIEDETKRTGLTPSQLIRIGQSEASNEHASHVRLIKIAPPQSLKEHIFIKLALRVVLSTPLENIRWLVIAYDAMPEAVCIAPAYLEKFASSKNIIFGKFFENSAEVPTGLTHVIVREMLRGSNKRYPPIWVDYVCKKFDLIVAARSQPEEQEMHIWTEADREAAQAHLDRTDARLSQVFKEAVDVPDGFNWTLADRLIKGLKKPQPVIYRDWLLATLEKLPPKEDATLGTPSEIIVDCTMTAVDVERLHTLREQKGLSPYMLMRGRYFKDLTVSHVQDLFYGRTIETRQEWRDLIFDLYEAQPDKGAREKLIAGKPLQNEADDFITTDDDRAHLRAERERTGVPDYALIETVGNPPEGLTDDIIQKLFSPACPPIKRSWFVWIVEQYDQLDFVSVRIKKPKIALPKKLPIRKVSEGRIALTDETCQCLRQKIKETGLSMSEIFKDAPNVPSGFNEKIIARWLKDPTTKTAERIYWDWMIAACMDLAIKHDPIIMRIGQEEKPKKSESDRIILTNDLRDSLREKIKVLNINLKAFFRRSADAPARLTAIQITQWLCRPEDIKTADRVQWDWFNRKLRDYDPRFKY